RNAYGSSPAGGVANNLYSPFPILRPALASPGLGGDLNNPGRVGETDTQSVALADTLSFVDDRVLVTLGVRHQTLEQKSYDYTTGAETASYKKSATTPVAGVVVKPMQNVSVYANYIEGL